MRLISIVGHSGSGKTTLIEKLLPELTRRGVRVATIKHTHHQVMLDTPGKDSWRYTQAGAEASMLVSGEGMQLVASKAVQHDPRLLAQRYMSDMDLVLVEGYSQAPGAKIEVSRQACGKPLRSHPQEGLIALVTDMGDAPHPELSRYALDDIGAIVDFILLRAEA